MCGGGGSSYKAPSPQEEAESRIWEQQQLQLMQQEQANQSQLAAEIAANKAALQAPIDLDNAYQSAYDRSASSLQLAGLNPADYDAQIRQQLDMIQSGVPQGATNPGTYFAGDIGSSIMANALQQQQANTLSQLNSRYAPGWTDTAIGGTADDAFIEDILNSQYGTAETSLQRALDRGNLTDVGYQAALGELGNQRTASMGDLQTIGGGILSGYRDSIGSLADQGFASSQYSTLQNPFDLQGLESRIGEKTTNDLRSNVGGRQFFDIGSLVNAGGAAQGAGNSASIATLMGNEADKQKQRGLGSQGVF